MVLESGTWAMTDNPQTKEQLQEEIGVATKARPSFKVVLFNDEDHTYDYVVDLLTTCCKLKRGQAFRCAVEVDLTGRTIVFYGTEEECTKVSEKINSFGPDFRMPRSMGSMESAVESL